MKAKAEEYFDNTGIPCDSYLTREIVINMLARFATQQVNLLNNPAVSINEGSGLCVSVAVMDTLKYRLATIQSETDRLTRETMIESFLVDITEY